MRKLIGRYQGNELTSILGLRPGPWLSGMLERVLDWQWQNVGADKAAAAAWVLGEKETLVLAGAVVAGENKRKKREKKEKV